MFVYLVAGFCCFVFILYLLAIMPDSSRKQDMEPFLDRDYAHRGLHDAQKLIPENSMTAFKEAIKQNLAIELDVHLTRDNQVVVFHDESLERLCHTKGTVEASTYEDLKRLRLLGTDERIPLLLDVLEYVNGRVPLLIELKLPARDMRLCFYTLKLLRQYNGPFLIQSFNSLGVRWFYKNAPHILRGQLSSALTQTDRENPYFARFCVQHLLTNILCRPNFISYKLKDSSNLSLWLNQKFYHIPVAVWTLRDPTSYQKAHRQFDMYIFEESSRKM